jgi:hypothetical protein
MVMGDSMFSTVGAEHTDMMVESAFQGLGLSSCIVIEKRDLGN